MSNTYTIIAIVGFALAAVLVLAAIIMYFSLNIKQVRDDLTGKTAVRSIAEIRLRAKTRKRSTNQVAKRYGWEKDQISTGELDALTRGLSNESDFTTFIPDEDNIPTSLTLAPEVGGDILGTTVLEETLLEDPGVSEDGSATTVLSPQQEKNQVSAAVPDTHSTPGTSPKKKATQSKGGKTTMVVLAFLVAVVMMAVPSLSWGDEAQAEQPKCKPLSLGQTLTANLSTYTIPYGVDIEEWLNKAVFGEDLAQAKSYFGGELPLIVSGGISSYPTPGTPLSFKWNTGATFTGGQLNPPVSLGAIIGKPRMGKLYTHLSDQALVRQGSKVFGTSDVSGKGDVAELWSPSKELSFSAVSGINGLEFVHPSGALSLQADGSFVDTPSTSLVLGELDTFPSYVYLRLAKDRNLTLAESMLIDPSTTKAITLYAGQVVRLPKLCVDDANPSLISMAWSAKANSDVTFEGIWYTRAASLTVSADDSPSGIKEIKLSSTENPLQFSELIGSYNSSKGAYVFQLPDGEYNLATMLVTVIDKAGRQTAGVVADYFKNEEQLSILDFSTVVVCNTIPPVTLSYTDGAAANAAMYKRDVTVTVSITDRYFERSKNRYTSPSYSGTIPVLFEAKRDGVIDPGLSLSYGDFVRVGNTNTWVAHCTLTAEGFYDLEVSYKSLFGIPSISSPNNSQRASLCLDRTKPVFESATFSPGRPSMWNWVFAPGEASFEVAINDTLSGIDPNELSIIIDGEEYPSSYNSTSKVLSCSFPADDRRVLLANMSVEIADRAGNRSSIGNMQNYEGRNLDESTQGIVVDSAAPSLDISYDNNDVCNERYYKAHRVATITVVEASFDLIKAHDPRRVIATKTVNGSTREIYAEDFENPTGDGLTWIGVFSCESDGEYRVVAHLTDEAGKESQLYEEEFVIDTVAPTIMITFDNNNSESGFYYKAPRAATITIFEENFSDSLTSVATEARDAAGNAQQAPGASTWQASSGAEWRSSVYFGSELHYAMQVFCSDLAGNVAQEVSEPEFVIDMTLPIARIEQVENYQAYGQEVMPRVYFEDTNFEAYLSEILITGAAQGEVYSLKNRESLTGISRTVDYSDFEYKLDVDDVYQMQATIKDKAGNTAEAKVVFSVNRYGSNYLLSEKSKALVGSYLKEASDIVITEINVSGLESSAIRVAKNDVVQTLDPKENDYLIEEGGHAAGWAQYTYTLPSELFTEDAYYRVMLRSRDLAGNYSENLMGNKNFERDAALELSFAVDGTSPVLTTHNVESNTAYFSPTRRVDIFMSDNMEAENAILLVNSERVMEWSAEDLRGSRAFSYDLSAFAGVHSVELEIEDKAGNIATTTLDGVIVTNDLVRYVLNTPAIFYPLLAGSIVLLGLLGIAITRIVIKRRKIGIVQEI